MVDQGPAIAADALRADAAMVYLLEGNWVDLRLAAGVGLAPGERVGTRLSQPADTLPGRVLQQAGRCGARCTATRDAAADTRGLSAAGLDAALAVPLSDRGRTIGALVVHARTAQQLGDDALRFLESVCNLLATCLQRAQSENALEHAQRLESVGQLTGGIAHDFNNLLTVIQGSLQVLEELPTLNDDVQGQQLVAAATRASRRGAELTGKLLAFSRRQVLQPSAVDVGQLVHSLAGMLRRTMDQRIRIEVDAPVSCPPVLADPGQLDPALLNIAINARDAMREAARFTFVRGGLRRAASPKRATISTTRGATMASSRSPSPTPAAACPTRSRSAPSSPSSPPRKQAGAPAWACPRCTASSASRRGHRPRQRARRRHHAHDVSARSPWSTEPPAPADARRHQPTGAAKPARAAGRG